MSGGSSQQDLKHSSQRWFSSGEVARDVEELRRLVAASGEPSPASSASPDSGVALRG